MSSIAYVSDPRMIEYARSSGLRELNFWRLSMRNFESFSPGSLLFFVDGRYQYNDTKEKGIIGFGRAKQFRKMNAKRMWKEYETKNGYRDYDAFTEAIMSSSKSGEIPKMMQCIELDEIVFFKGPIYLNEIGEELPSQLESFTYLDRDDRGITDQILDLALEVGIDEWYQTLNPSITLETIKNHQEEQSIRGVLETINHPFTLQQRKLIESARIDFTVNSIGYHKIDNHFEVILPCTAIKQQQYSLMGIIAKIKNDKPYAGISFKIILRNGSPEPIILKAEGTVLEYI